MGTKVAAVAAVGLLALGAGACADGGGEVATDGPAVEAPDGAGTGGDLGALTPAATASFMAASARATAEVPAMRVTMTMRAEGVEGMAGDPVLMAVDGAFSGDGTRGTMTIDLSGMLGAMGGDLGGGDDLGPMGDALTGMFTEPWDVVVDGEDTYVRMPAVASLLGAGTEWIRTPTEGGSTAVGGGFGPATSATDLVGLLEGAGEVVEVGTEDVGGAATTHYQVDLDPAALADAVGDERAAELEGLAPGAVVLDVWIGDDGLVRRMEMAMDLAALGSGLGGGDAQGRMLLAMEMSDFGQEVDVVVPDPSTVTDAEDLGGGLLGGG